MEPRRQSSWQNNIDWSQKLVWFSGSTQTNKNYLTNSVIYSSIQLIRGGKKKAYVSDHYSKNPTYEFICSMCQYLRTQTWRIERRERIGVGSPANNIVKIVIFFFQIDMILLYQIQLSVPIYYNPISESLYCFRWYISSRYPYFNYEWLGRKKEEEEELINL